MIEIILVFLILLLQLFYFISKTFEKWYCMSLNSDEPVCTVFLSFFTVAKYSFETQAIAFCALPTVPEHRWIRILFEHEVAGCGSWPSHACIGTCAARGWLAQTQRLQNSKGISRARTFSCSSHLV